MILTRKSHNCAGTAFVQGDSGGGSKLIEQTLREISFKGFFLLFFLFFDWLKSNHPKSRIERAFLDIFRAILAAP